MRNEVVERELSELVNILVTTVPSLKTVRVAGSYNNGNWNSEKSDIDMVVLIDDEFYSYRRDRIDIPGGDCAWISRSSVQRRELESKIREQMTGEYKDRFSLAMITPDDLKHIYFFNEGRGPIGKNYSRGRLLYGEKTIRDKFNQKKERILGYCKQVKNYIGIHRQNSQVQSKQAI